MIATHNQQAPADGTSPHTTTEQTQINHLSLNNIKNYHATQLLLPNRLVTHTPKAGLNPLVDAASHLFSIIGKIKYIGSYRQLGKLQKELTQEIHAFQQTVESLGYNTEYILVCRYILCATIDDLICDTTWGGSGQWDSYSLLVTFNQDPQHQDKFFTILERALSEPALYIDLMELSYLCLCLGYKGQYRNNPHNYDQLEQISNNLYKHIRAHRGNISKVLSPTPYRPAATTQKSAKHYSPLFIFFVMTCIIMTIFVSLSYLMDVISNEAYKNITQINIAVSNEAAKQ